MPWRANEGETNIEGLDNLFESITCDRDRFRPRHKGALGEMSPGWITSQKQSYWIMLLENGQESNSINS